MRNLSSSSLNTSPLWVDDGNASCGKLLRNGRLIPFESLTGPQINFWRYRKLHHFFEVHGSSIRDIASLTHFAGLFIADEPVPHMVSELYQLLGSSSLAAKPLYIRVWERDLGLEFSNSQLTYLYQLTHSSSIDSKMQETNYKILSRWYWVPANLARIYSSTSELCWQGCGGRGTLVHLWWDSPVIVLFWKDIR